MKSSLLFAVASAALVCAYPGQNNANSNGHKGTPHTPQCHGLTRPNVKPHPHHPKNPGPSPGHRNGKQCIVQTYGDGTDDSDLVLTALKRCNKGGHVIFAPNTTYTIGTALDLTWLQSIDLDIQGTIKFTNDTDYWQAHGFSFVFQNVTTFFKLGGDDVAMYGGGTLDGNGQAWYDLYASNPLILRPVLMGIDGLKNSVISNLVMRYSPQYYHFIANSTNVLFDSIDISGFSSSKNVAKNTDGWDTYRSSDITIQNSVINNGDDCVSFKPNSSNIVVQGLHCNGSHGVSVGSLGQYVGEYDIVENIYVSNIKMYNASDMARIKVWPNAASSMSVDLQGGGGSGRVSNITYENLYVENVDYAIEVTSCYGQKNLTLCLEYPSPIVIENVVFRNFTGTTSKKYEPYMATLQCSSKSVCRNITAMDINVTSPKGSRKAQCLNVDDAALDVQCVDVKV